ncbi:SNARE associated Golgi protein [Pseudohyphozyma bogoriensis]|nr:SNARE associated Golgi protein [Pseudohyphozyma bogoriensis]
MGVGSAIKHEVAEAREANRELVQWAKKKDWKQSAKNLFQWKYAGYWALVIIIGIATLLLSIFHDRIVKAFEPHKEAIVHAPVSWLAPAGLLVILSFPPLFGHGLIWGLWVGFAIVVGGTFIGELACFFAFKYFFTKRAEKIEHGSILYACLARLMREGGLVIIILVRFSVIPGHIVTALQSTVGMPVWIYCIAVLVSMPKQLVYVYLGVLFGISKDTTSESHVTHERIISLSVFFGTAVMTLIAFYVVYMRARKLYPQIVAEREGVKVEDVSVDETGRPYVSSDENHYYPNQPQVAHYAQYGSGSGAGGGGGYGNPYRGGQYGSTSEIPLTAGHGVQHIDPFTDVVMGDGRGPPPPPGTGVEPTYQVDGDDRRFSPLPTDEGFDERRRVQAVRG